MRATALLRELVRDLISGTARVGLFAMVGAVALTLVILAEILATSALVRQGVEYQQAGADVVTLSLPGRVSGSACEALTNVGGVVAAGGLRASHDVGIDALPSSPLKQYQTTPSFARVLAATERGRGAYFSDDVVQAVRQSQITIEGRRIDIRGTYAYPPDGRRAGFGWAMLFPTYANDGVFDECWVKAWPERPDTRQLLLTTIVAQNADASKLQPKVVQLNSKFGEKFGGAESYANRASRFAPGIALAIATFLGFVAVWIRRVELAANLHVGLRRSYLIALSSVEVVAWALPAALFGLAAGGVAADLSSPSEIGNLMLQSAQIALLFLAGSAAGALVAAFLVRESRLWSYVKGR